MNDFSTFKEQINTFNAEKELASEDYSVESLTAGRTSLIYNTQGEDTAGNIQTVIPSMNDNYAEKFEIIKGELLLWASSELEYDIAVGMGIKVSPYIIVDGVLLSANQNLALQSTDGVVTLPERVEVVGAGAFSGVEGLKEIIIPWTVKEIRDDAFSYNTEIEKVTIQSKIGENGEIIGVERIGDNAFRECSSLRETTMPDSVVEIGKTAFRECTNLEKVQLSNNITSIQSQTFNLCYNLTRINMPESLTQISSEAFSGCYKLDNIHIPSGVSNISTGAFGSCTNLYNLTIDEGNSTYEVEDGIIYKKDNSTLIMLVPMATKETVTIREGIKRLDSSSLSICTSMTKLELPSSLEYITGRAFSTNSTKLETITIPESNKYYKAEDGYIYSKDGKELVYVVASKKNIEINEKVETLKTGAIYYTSATEITIPDNVKKIEGNAFRYSRSNTLKSIHIGKGVNDLSPSFKAWGNLTGTIDITIDEENSNYKVDGNLILTKDGKKVVIYIKNVESQTIPEGVETIGTNALTGFSATEIILPSTLKTIESQAFINCFNITTITIPSSVETIGTYAFRNCGNLAEIRIDKEAGSIAGSPWSVPKGDRAIIWLR